MPTRSKSADTRRSTTTVDLRAATAREIFLLLLSLSGSVPSIPSPAGLGRDTVAAAISGVHSLSRSLGFFVDGEHMQRRQTLVEFDGGWVFLISAGEGTYLAVSAAPDIDMADITFRMQQLVGQLGKDLARSPREDIGHRS